MAEIKKKKLSMKQATKNHSKYDEVTEVTFTERDQETGELVEFYVNVKPFISNSSIKKAFELFRNSLNQWEEIGLDVNDDNFWGLLYYSVVKVQTDLTTPKNAKDDMQYFTILTDDHYFEEILSNIEESEQAKVVDFVYKMVETDQRIQKQLQKQQENIENLDIQSPELYEKIHGKEKRIPEA